jgi:hypothetical protein
VRLGGEPLTPVLIGKTLFDKVMKRIEYRASHWVQRCHALVIVGRRTRPPRRAVEPARDFLLKPANEIARGAQIIVLIAPVVRKASRERLDARMVLGPDAVAVGEPKARLPRPQEAFDRIAQRKFEPAGESLPACYHPLAATSPDSP